MKMLTLQVVIMPIDCKRAYKYLALICLPLKTVKNLLCRQYNELLQT